MVQQMLGQALTPANEYCNKNSLLRLFGGLYGHFCSFFWSYTKRGSSQLQLQKTTNPGPKPAISRQHPDMTVANARLNLSKKFIKNIKKW